MTKRVKKLWWKLKRKNGFDVLVTHSPAKGLHDGEDTCHTGFDVFNRLIEQYKPRYFVHGHVHMSYGRQFVRLIRWEKLLLSMHTRNILLKYRIFLPD